MFGWLRKFFREWTQPAPVSYMEGVFEMAIKRRQELLPCCGQMRGYHVAYRSGALKCPHIWKSQEDFNNAFNRAFFSYNPLEIDEGWEPPWAEMHYKCDRCGCSRGLHEFREDGKRGNCTDPDCPGCPGGCLLL